MRFVALIPVKKESERVKNKNFKNFFNKKSLLDILISKLKKCNDISEIYISSNSKLAEKVAKKNNCQFLERKDEFSDNIKPWSEVIYEIVNSIPEQNNTVLMWCHVTTPLLNSYNEAINIFKKKIFKNDGLISVEKLSKFIVTGKKMPLNYAWGVWHPYSQNLDILYSITGALFMMRIKQFKENRYVVSKNPYYLISKKFEGLDIDTYDDFKLAQLVYKNKL